MAPIQVDEVPVALWSVEEQEHEDSLLHVGHFGVGRVLV